MMLVPGALAAKIVDTDHFKVQIIDTYDDVWDDAGSGAKLSVTIVRPRSIEPGYYFFGDVAIPMDKKKAMKDPPHSFAVKPLTDQDKSRLAPPESLRWMYSDKGSGNSRNIAIYMANCPRGYVALGAVAMDNSSIGDGDEIPITSDKVFDRIRNYTCITEREVIRAAWQSEPLWNPLDNDGNKRGDYNVSLWQADYTGGLPPAGTLVVSPRAIFPVRSSTDAPLASEGWALKLYLKNLPNLTAPVGISGRDLKKLIPSLDGPWQPSDPSATQKAADYTVPFFMVNDPKYSALEQWLTTPTYTVTRSISYKFYREYDNTDCAVPSADNGTFTYVTGSEKGTEDSTGTEAGASSSFTAGLTIGVKATEGVEGVGSVEESVEVSTSWTTEFSMAYSSGHTASDSATEETTWEQSVPRGTYAALYLKTSTYEIHRNGAEDKTAVDSSGSSFDHDQPVFLTWAPAGWSAKNPCGAQLGIETPVAAAGDKKADGDDAVDIVVAPETQAPPDVTTPVAAEPIKLPPMSGILSCSISGKPCSTNSAGFYLTTDSDKRAKIVEFAEESAKPVIKVEYFTLQDGRPAVLFSDAAGNLLRVNQAGGFTVSFDAGFFSEEAAFLPSVPMEGGAVDFASFESVAFPGRFLRHRGLVLFADPADRENELFRRDATWRVVDLNK